MGMANVANVSNPTGAGCHMDISSYIQAIQQNWFIQAVSEDEHILPPSLLAGVPVNCLPAGIIQAVHELSTLTIGQRDRAHNLLNTYFQARIREGSYSAKTQNIFAILEISDVKKTCESLRRMSRGREMQGPVPIKEEETRKRKYSIRHELATTDTDDDEDGQRLAKRLKEELCVISEEEHTNEPITPTPFTLECIPTPPDSQATLPATLSSSIPTTPRTQRRIRLPPIRTTEINMPTATTTSPDIAPFSSFTPLFNSLKQEFGNGDPDTPCPIRQDTYQQQQQQQQFDHSNNAGNSTGNGNGMVWDNCISDSFEAPKMDPRVLAAQRATHEFNVRRMQVIEAQRAFEEARRRFGEAKRRMLGARGRCGWR